MVYVTFVAISFELDFIKYIICTCIWNTKLYESWYYNQNTNDF